MRSRRSGAVDDIRLLGRRNEYQERINRQNRNQFEVEKCSEWDWTGKQPSKNK